jgi:hypothetical protein
MVKRFLLLVVALGLVVVIAGAGFAPTAEAQGGQHFATTLSGAEEVNGAGVPNQGDPDGSGFATLTVNRGLGEICFDITVQDITLPAILAHIHNAAAGVNGAIVVPLTAPDATGHSSGCVSVDRELVKDIAKHPENYYVNVHTTDFPSGALRGQLGD